MPTTGGDAPGSRVTVVPRCKNAGRRLVRLPAVDQAGLRGAQKVPASLASLRVRLPPPATAPRGAACGTRRLRANTWTASLAARSPGTWAGRQYVCWARLGRTPGCTLTLEGPLPGPWAPRCDGLCTPSFLSTVCRPCGWKSAGAAPESTQSRTNVATPPLGPPPGLEGLSVWRSGACTCVNARKRAHKRMPLLLKAHKRQVCKKEKLLRPPWGVTRSAAESR